MKKLYLFLTLVLWGIAQVAEAQNIYRNYRSTNVRKPQSAISVVHSNGFVYFFQADANGNLSTTEIDPLSMNPTGTTMYYQLTLQNNSNFEFYLNGGFEDSNGDFVLFGRFHNYITSYSYISCPMYIVVTSNLTSCYPRYFTTQGEFTAGCSGYDLTGTMVYMMVNNGSLTAIDPTSPNLATKLNPLIPNVIYQDQFTDISWDGIHGHFIASGSAWNSPTGHEDPFIEVFDFFSNFITPVAAYIACNHTYDTANEYKSLHVQLDDDQLVLYHDLRRVNHQNYFSYDIIWLTRIENYWDATLATVPESRFYYLPNNKLFATDMLYDQYNNHLNFLGYYNYCMQGVTQILAQVNPYMLSSGINIGQLGAAFFGGYCNDLQDTGIHIFYNNLKMFNLAWNFHNPCYPLLIAGVDDSQSLLTETYDISLSSCDKPMWHEEKPAPPTLITYTPTVTHQLDTVFHAQGSCIGESILVSVICDEPETTCSHQFGGKIIQRFLTNDYSFVSFSMEGNHVFTCEGFEGEIQYLLYDVTGKLLQQGFTHNGDRVLLNLSDGVYLLKVNDAKGHQVVKKVIKSGK